MRYRDYQPRGERLPADVKESKVSATLRIEKEGEGRKDERELSPVSRARDERVLMTSEVLRRSRREEKEGEGEKAGGKGRRSARHVLPLPIFPSVALTASSRSPKMAPYPCEGEKTERVVQYEKARRAATTSDHFPFPAFNFVEGLTRTDLSRI